MAEPAQKFEHDETGGVYDKDKGTRPNLKALEDGSQQDSSSVGQSHPITSGKSAGEKSKSLSAEQLGKAESSSAETSQVGGAISALNDPGLWKGEGKGQSQGGFRGKLQQVASVAGEHRKAVFGGVGGGLITLLLLLGISGVVSHELVNIEKNLVGYESKEEKHFERKASKTLLQKAICWQVKVGCRKIASDNDKPSATEEAQAEAEGKGLTTEMDKLSLTDPAIQQDLATQGISVQTDASGAPTGLQDAQGQDVTEAVASDDSVFDYFNKALPEWEVGQEISFRPTEVEEAGATFNVLKDSSQDGKTQVDDAVEKGATSEDLANASAEEKGQQPDQNASQTDQNAYRQAADQSSEIEQIDQKINADEAAGMSQQAAEADAASVFHNSLGTALVWSAIATAVCQVKQVAEKAAAARVPTIITALIRHATTTFSLADQLKTGHVTGDQINQVMQIFNGNPTSPNNADGTPSEALLPFSASAAWQRATGEPVTSYTPEIEQSAKPEASAGQAVVNEIESVIHTIPGADFTCSVLTSGWGILAQIGLGIIQLGATVFTGGTVDAATIAAGTAANAAIQKVVIPDIIKYFTPIGVSGHEDSVQWLNNADAGANLAFGNYSRRLGGSALTKDQANTLTAEANHDQMVAESHLSWTERTFALSNPRSLVSRLASYLPFGLRNTASGIVGYFSRLPQTIFHDIASIFTTHQALAQEAATNPGEPYGATQYAFTDSETDKYDPIANEQYLFQTVNYNGGSVKRIDMLGNPNNYAGGDDPNNADLLHCYVDSYATIEEANSNFDPTMRPEEDPGADQNCGAVGMYDFNSAPPNDTDTPNDTTVAHIYCVNLAPFDSSCPSAIMPQIHDDVGHFRQYLLDLQVMKDYTSLGNNQ